MKMNRRLTIAFLVISSLLCAAYLGKGFAYAVAGPLAGDRERRWTEQQYVIRGQNPYDVRFRMEAVAEGKAPPASRRDDSPAPDLALPSDADYPPWSYFSGYLFFATPWRFVRIWYATIEVLALAAIVAAVLRLSRGLPPLQRAVPVLAVTSIAAICTDLATGNYGLIVLALLLWACHGEAAGREAPAGLLMGIAQLKPNLAGPFLLVPLVRLRWRTLAVSAAYLAVASGVVWAITKTDPIEMCGQMVRAARIHVINSEGPLRVAMDLGVPYEKAVPLAASVCVGIGFVLMILWRRDNPLVLYAIAAVTSRFWTYHLNYSNVILAFLSLALWQTAIATGRRGAWGFFLFVTASLWIPAKAADHPVGQVAERLVWLVGLAGLLYLRKAMPATPPAEAGDPAHRTALAEAPSS
jgi:hypothetical protein